MILTPLNFLENVAITFVQNITEKVLPFANFNLLLVEKCNNKKTDLLTGTGTLTGIRTFTLVVVI